jgi:Holliday junction resolvase
VSNRYYERGARLEYEVRKLFRDAGYDIVERTAGSHGVFDVIAMKNAGTFEKQVWFTCLMQMKTKDYPKKKERKK